MPALYILIAVEVVLFFGMISPFFRLIGDWFKRIIDDITDLW